MVMPENCDCLRVLNTFRDFSKWISCANDELGIGTYTLVLPCILNAVTCTLLGCFIPFGSRYEPERENTFEETLIRTHKADSLRQETKK